MSYCKVTHPSREPPAYRCTLTFNTFPGQVSDCVDGSISDYNPGSMQASAVYKAYEYAAKMGAHVISFSIAPTLGQGALGLNSLTISQGIKPPYPWNNTYAAQNMSYITAIKPLQDKNMLLVAAAGVGGGSRC